ncbi:MAG: hypothetical protein SPH57_12655 [Bacteroides helcogenes]|nr:hypothetical protein [Bacteroides helcogenes]MDY5239295.1 hypothetical protein [Bacteroides helcogenes]
MNEKESLELIAQMIQNTRKNLDAGSGNMFLLWGYVSALIALVVFAGVYFTKNPVWMWGFWGIPVVGYTLSYFLLWKQQKPVRTYVDKVLADAWKYLGVLCMVFVVGATYTNTFETILPLCAILLSVGSIFTGAVIRQTSFFALPGLGVVLGMNMFFDVWDKTASYFILLEFALVVIFSMIIPGHILNNKVRKEIKNRK